MLKIILLATLFAAGTVQAETLSCLIQVVKAQDLSKSSDDTSSYTKTVRLKIEDGEIDQEETINNELVVFSGFRYEYTDLYQITAMVLNNPNDSIANALAVANYRLYNNGPVTKSGFAPDVKKGSTGFENLDFGAGQYTFSRLMRKELERAGIWGKHPYTEMSVAAGSANLDEMLDLVKNSKTIKADDVVMMSQLFACTYNK